jgi:hypothetical protein
MHNLKFYFVYAAQRKRKFRTEPANILERAELINWTIIELTIRSRFDVP